MSVQIQKKKTWLKELVKELRRLIEVLEYDTIHVKHEVGKKILPLYHKGKIQRGTITKIAEGIGWSRQEVHRCIKFARKYPTPQDAIRELSHICDSLTWYNICEFLLPDERRPTPPLPEGSFDVIYADPPWRYEVDWLDASPNSHYPTMTTEEICRLEVPERCSENAVLFLWTTNPMLEEALEVMKAWGFQYRKCTVDGRSHWNPTRRVNIYYVLVSKIPEAEKVLGAPIKVKEEYRGGVEAETEARRKDTLRIFHSVEREVVNVLHNEVNHPIPFDYVDLVWSIIKEYGSVEPIQLRAAIGRRLGLSEAEVYGKRGIYHRHYYYPVKVLQRLDLVWQKGTGSINLTTKGLETDSWREELYEE